MNKKLAKFFPPGYPRIKNNIAWLAAVEAVVLIVGIATYGFRYRSGFGPNNLRFSGTIYTFNDCIHGAFTLYWFYLLVCMVLAIVLRTYFTRRSNSDYIMRRLEKGSEMTRRWLAVPLITAVLGLALCIIAILFMRLHYQLATPPQYMPENGPVDFVRAFFSSVFRSVSRGTAGW